MALNILYSYRRCPYAMRARMALKYAEIPVVIREISLRYKPAEMLKVSPKGTVPVLVFSDDSLNKKVVIEQSLEIMYWALRQRDVDGWLTADGALTEQLIAENDGDFKRVLDKYKYAIRFPEQAVETYRAQGEIFLVKLEVLLNQTQFLLNDKVRLADIAIFPFIRQFASVDNIWFESAPYPRLKIWLKTLAESELFLSVMEKQPT
ncbi:MAG: glutathione S-transferase [Methylotenera sp.]|uniref:glutathione S-transferase n=1 Tax=Methylotenera sp. TaxID=2051956 RepID=UPI00271A9387|nr:glutathione S-transferase [Methylotenera sp.]MDO9392836.1 glutathione S-transferase [Methylotenera sp.]